MGDHMNTHTRFRTHFPARLLTTVVVLSAMIATHSASAVSVHDDYTQQVNPPLAHAQEIIKHANTFLDIKEEPIIPRIDEEQARKYGMLASAGTAVLSGACWISPAIYKTIVCGGASALFSGAKLLAECLNNIVVGPNAGFVLVPAAVGLISYIILQEGTTRSYFKKAVLKAAPVIKTLKNDGFFNGSFDERELVGYVRVTFGVEQGALKALEHYNGLHVKLQEIDALLKEVVDTEDADLAQQSCQLQAVVKDLSIHLTKKIAIASHCLNDDIKEQLKQQREDNGRLAAELARERDRSAAIQAGNISYQRTVR